MPSTARPAGTRHRENPGPDKKLFFKIFQKKKFMSCVFLAKSRAGNEKFFKT